MSLKTELKEIVAGEVVSDHQTRKEASGDASIFRITPKVVVYPKHVRDIRALVDYAARQSKIKGQRSDVSLTVRSGGTDMTGGPLSSSIVLDMTRYFSGPPTISTQSFTALPGTYFRDIERALSKRHLLYPAYPASKGIATIGGMVANNAGGELTLRYGKTDRYIRHVRAVLSDSQEYDFRRLSPSQIDQKLAQPGFEGDLYRRLVPMFRTQNSLIKAAKPLVTKNSSGYNIWSVYNPADGSVDLAQLLVGSQGTLGILTEVELGVIPEFASEQLLVIYLPTLDRLGRTVDLLSGLDPTSIELFDDKTLKLALHRAPQLAKRLRVEHSLLGLARDLLPDLGLIVKHGFPKLVLLASFAGQSPTRVGNAARAAESMLTSLGLPVRLLATKEAASVYWLIRRESFNLLRHEIKGAQTVPFIDDLVVPPYRLHDFLPALYNVLGDYPQLDFSIAGHAGDANLHVFPIMDMTSERLRSLIPVIADRVYALTLEYGGSLSGEHNDGLIRGPYLETMYQPEIVDIFQSIKQVFDPQGIFNPHKKLDATPQYAAAHMKHDNQHSV